MTVLLSPNVTRDVLRCVESIKQASSRCQQSTENESDDASLASDDVHSETIDNSHITIAQHSPWTALANEIKNQPLKAHGQDEGKASSRYFSPDSVEMVIKKFMHIYPLWSGSHCYTLFTLSLTRPSPKLPSPVWPWPGEHSD